ncbi:hypothetical protein BKA93DRAFT_745340, partial [Sparassis latifolia]
LMQLRTGHVGLNQHLHRICKTPSPICPACHLALETVQHFLLTCTAYTGQRHALQLELSAAGSLSRLLTNPKAMKPLFCYIHTTGRFLGIFGPLDSSDKQSNDLPEK